MKTKLLMIGFLSIMNQMLLAASLTIGEMTIKIQDAATGKPITGMYVSRGITTQYVPFSIIGIGIEAKQVSQPDDYAISNSDGIVTFPRKNVPRKKYNEGVSFIHLSLNFGQDGESIFSNNRTNDALSLSLISGRKFVEAQYEVVKSSKPRQEYIRYQFRYDFNEPYKTIVIKLGNASFVENGNKTQVTFEEAVKK